MIVTVLLESSISAASWDAVIESIHRCTPLLYVRRHGVLHAGTDNLDEVRRYVRLWSARAAMTPDRTSSLFCALNGVPGRIDAHASAEHVPCSVLRECPEVDVDDVMLQRLRLFGCSTLGVLMTLSERHLRAQFGDLGIHLHRLLHTTSTSLPLYQPPDDISVEDEFDDAVSEPSAILHAIDRLCSIAVEALAGREAWRIDVGILDRSGHVSSRRGRIMRGAVTSLQQLTTHVHALISQLCSSLRRWWGVRLRLSSLRLPLREQVALFQAQPSAQDIQSSLVPKYGPVIKDIQVINPWSVIPEEYARILGRQP